MSAAPGLDVRTRMNAPALLARAVAISGASASRPSSGLAVKASAPHFHKHGAAGVISNKFYVAGGFHDFDPVAALDVYDPATNTWKTLGRVPGGGGSASGAVINGKLFVAIERRAYIYDPATNQWKARAAPPSGGPLTPVSISGKSYVFLAGTPSELYTP